MCNIHNNPTVVGHIDIRENHRGNTYVVCDVCNRKFYGNKSQKVWRDGNGARQICEDCITEEEMGYWESFGPDECESNIFDGTPDYLRME